MDKLGAKMIEEFRTEIDFTRDSDVRGNLQVLNHAAFESHQTSAAACTVVITHDCQVVQTRRSYKSQ